MHDIALRCRADVVEGKARDQREFGPVMDLKHTYLLGGDDLYSIDLLLVRASGVCDGGDGAGAEMLQ